jgi:hypothetical protein
MNVYIAKNEGYLETESMCIENFLKSEMELLKDKSKHLDMSKIGDLNLYIKSISEGFSELISLCEMSLPYIYLYSFEIPKRSIEDSFVISIYWIGKCGDNLKSFVAHFCKESHGKVAQCEGDCVINEYWGKKELINKAYKNIVNTNLINEKLLNF